MHIKKFSHFSALKQLLDLDARHFNEETHYPWFCLKQNIILLITGWFIVMLLLFSILFWGASLQLWIPSITIIVSSLIFAVSYFLVFHNAIKVARTKPLKKMMKLEQRGFVNAIEPFIPQDQQIIAKRIIKDQNFRPDEYLSIILSTQSKILFNADSFLEEVERLCQDQDINTPLLDDKTYSDTVFKVPESLKRKYQEQQERGTFNDIFAVPEDAKQKVLLKLRELEGKDYQLGGD